MPKKAAKGKRPISPTLLAKLRENARKAREVYRARQSAKGEKGPPKRAQLVNINPSVRDWRGETISVGDTVVCPGHKGEALFMSEGIVTDIRKRVRGQREFTVFDVLQRSTPNGSAKRVSVWTSWITKVSPCNNSEQGASSGRISKNTKASSFAERHWPEDEWSHAAFSGKCLIAGPNYEVEAVRVYEAYRDYCEQNGKPASRRNSLTSWLVRELRIRRRHSDNRDYYVGVRLRHS